jgi:hypothetical protein
MTSKRGNDKGKYGDSGYARMTNKKEEADSFAALRNDKQADSLRE